MLNISRRSALGFLGAVSLGQIATPVFAQGQENRKFIFILLRGGMDGLSALIPDSTDITSARDKILPSIDTRLNLGNGFRLHPSFKGLKTLYDDGHVSFIHACSTSYRARSHFEAQDAIEILGNGGSRKGWLNRALTALNSEGLAIARGVPLAMQGPQKVKNWSPPLFNAASDDLLDRLTTLYAQDVELMTSLAIARKTTAFDMPRDRRSARRFTYEYPIPLEAIGQQMAIEGGPGVGMVALDGWDTHSNQVNKLNRKFFELDKGLTALKQELGHHWKQTCIVVCSEFGRTVAMNGTRGTDHGTGGLVMVLGGAVAGGKMKGEWPGLKPSALYEGRDLAPVNDVTSVLKGILRDHLGIDRRTLDQSIFPNSARAFDGLIRS